MNQRSKHLLTISMALVLLAVPAASQEPPAQDDHNSLFMRAKLSASNHVMEGIVTENFKLVHQAANDMKEMSRGTQWPTADDATYQHYQRAFQMDCDELARHAAQENLAGAHFTFLQLTSHCVDCHRHVRRAFRVERNEKNPKGPVMLIPNHWDEGDEPTTTEAAYRSKQPQP